LQFVILFIYLFIWIFFDLDLEILIFFFFLKNSIVKVSQNPYEYFADRLEDTMRGLGTDDRGLIRLVVSRCEVDMMNIKEIYFQRYKRTLEKAVHSETSGIISFQPFFFFFFFFF